MSLVITDQSIKEHIMMRKCLVTSILYLIISATAFAQTVTTKVQRVYTTQKVNLGETIAIDGVLTDLAWNSVPWASDFTVFDPNNGEKPSQSTKFKITYDEKFLYVGIHCYDSVPSKIEKRLARRDNFSGDWIEINIDSYNDKRTGFSFNVSAAGVKGD